jgi:hypothetical protein
LESIEHEPDQLLRVAMGTEGSLGLVLDSQREGDQVIEHENVPVLVIEPELSDSLSGALLDVRDTPEGPRLALTSG